MNGFSKHQTILLLSALLLGGILLIGCSEDDPVTPRPLPEAGYLAVTPDSLMALWQTALVSMDSTMYGDVLHPDFQFIFRPSDVNDFQLLTDYMTREETLHTGWNMFSGEDVPNWQGVVIPGVSRISLPFMIQQTPWEIVAAGSANATASARFMLQMFVERGFGYPILNATGVFDFLAVQEDTVDADGIPAEYYRLMLMTEVDPESKSSEVNTWGGVHLVYLANEEPEAHLQVSDMGGSPLPLFQCDASGSQDIDSGILAEGYRWQFDTAGSWTDWGADSILYHDYLNTGPKNITVEVRDRWGARSTASQEVLVVGPVLPFPSSPDVLMDNFQAAYEMRYFQGYQELMHPDFLTILQQSTTDEFPDVGTTLDVNEELRIHQRMLSGVPVTDPNGYLIPAVEYFAFNRFRALDTWTMSPPDDIIPNTEWAPYEVDILLDRGQMFSTLKVQGTIKFYVTSRDSLVGETMRKYYQMVGQVDLTNLGKAVEGLSWGSVKALWR